MSGSFQFQGNTYRVADYYTEAIPEFTGGFLLDMDFRSLNDQYKYFNLPDEQWHADVFPCARICQDKQ